MAAMHGSIAFARMNRPQMLSPLLAHLRRHAYKRKMLHGDLEKRHSSYRMDVQR
jgi:hypothetical protein